MATLTTGVWTELRALRGTASGLEIRADLTGDLNPNILREHIDGQLIYSLRSAEYYGAFTGGAAERTRRLLAAAWEYDVIDLEVDRDLTPELLAVVPPHRRRISWYGRGRDHVGLASVLGRMATTPARLYLLAPEAETVEQAMAPLRLLGTIGRSDVTAFATGELGVFSRLLAPWLGAAVVFGGLGRESVHGVPTVDRLLHDFPFPALPPLELLFGIVGRPARWSRSPRLHNTAYHALGLPALYLPLPANEFSRSWRAMRTGFDHLGLAFGGATVVAPYKEEALRSADTVSTEAATAGAANLLVRKAGGWRAYTTDPIGVVGTLRRAGVRLAGRTAAVVGCGGAGRGAAAGLLQAGARPTMVNRGAERGRYAAELLGIDYVPLARFSPQHYSIIVHATPVRGEPPFSANRIADDAVVVDLAYGPEETGLVAVAKRQGIAVVDGWRVLMVEVARQFRLMTGRSMPTSMESRGGDLPTAAPQREFA